MGILDHPIPRTAKRWLGWVLRPRLSYRRIREMRRAKSAPPVRADLDLSRLPPVTVRQAVQPAELERVLQLYRRNPSALNIAPRTRKSLQEMIARDVEFYLVLDAAGDHVANLGYQAPRQMFSYLQVDFRHRGRGIGLAAKRASEEIIAARGVEVAYLQVFRENRRALSTFFSLGWEIDEDASTDKYYVLQKRLSGVTSPGTNATHRTRRSDSMESS